MDPIRAEAIRTLYVQARNSAAAAAVVTVYMIVTGLPYTSATTIALWVAAQVLTQGARFGLVAAFHRRAHPDLDRWARAYTAYMALAGLMWGSTAFLFVHLDQPITLALTMCGLYGISGGSVSGNAYNPSGLYAFVGGIFGCVLVRMLMLGDSGHIALGVASACYAGILLLFCRVQARTIDEGFRIRFENLALLDELVVQKGEAEDARRRAELANLAKSQFLAAASHDLRQPLYALTLFSASLESLRLDRKARAIVGDIQANVAALESLFNGLLDVSRLEAGVVVATREPVSVDALFDRLSNYFRPAAAERGLDLRFRSDGEWVSTDPMLVEQILANLLSNALRNTESGGVLLAARRRGARLRFEVWDTGIGIAPEDEERIFDDFVQVGNPERDRRKGMGLGLSIARRSVELLGGRIALRSRPGRGTRFSFEQPLTEAPLARRGEILVPGTDDRLAGLPILVVDDDVAVSAALGQLLTSWGVRAKIVATAEAAWAALDGSSFALVLADYRLRGDTDGLSLLSAIAGMPLTPMPAMALVTGDLDPAIIARAQALRVPLLHKPLAPARLRALLQSAAMAR